jgi:hypothetical protein
MTVNCSRTCKLPMDIHGKVKQNYKMTDFLLKFKEDYLSSIQFAEFQV